MKKIVMGILAIVVALLLAAPIVFMLTGCSAADTVNQNLSQAADNFE